MNDIYNLIWTDKYGAYDVCPDCHGVACLMSEDENGQQEWLCDACWHIHDENGRYVRKWHRQGLERHTCPECGDFRIDKDPYDNDYYCRNCKSVFRKPQGETIRNADGQAVDWRMIDLGPVEYPETCLNCGDPLRRQWFDLPNGKGLWAFPCHRCDDIVYLEDGGRLVVPGKCQKCGGYALETYTRKHTDFKTWPLKRTEERLQFCRLCKTEYDLDGDYLHDADRPTHGNRQLPKSVIGMISSNPNNTKPQ